MIFWIVLFFWDICRCSISWILYYICLFLYYICLGLLHMFGTYFKPLKCHLIGNKYEQNCPKIKCTLICIGLFHMKITVSFTKSLYQDCATCFLHLLIFCVKHTLSSSAGKKVVWNVVFHSKLDQRSVLMIFIMY